MKFTLSWLKDHLDTTASLQEITDKLVDLGLEVESIDNPADNLRGFVVGQVKQAGKHPNADRLNLCQVDAGTGALVQVVCGATNVREGMKVVFAAPGTKIPATGVVLKKGVIRDVESHGMMCSARELGLGEDHDGIIDLKTEAAPGTPFVDILGADDPVIDLSITPNRSDCFGIRGIARDLAAAGLGTLKPLSTPSRPTKATSPLSVTIEEGKSCSAFKGVYIKNVKNTQSPEWVQSRLKAVGMRPINALVDVTNYVNLDLCRPLHVFDADKIQGLLTVGLSKEGESFEALNEKSYTLKEGMIVIRDESGVISLAGIMGGFSTACSENTTNVFLECAAFDPVRIAHTGQSLQILSDSRTRFERGVDPQSLDYGLEYAVHLILEWCGGEASPVVTAEFSEEKPEMPIAKVIQLTSEKLHSLGGCNIPAAQATQYLTALGFEVSLTQEQGNDWALSTTVPTHRPDIEGSADLVEEILRLKGYDSIPAVKLPPADPILVTKSALDMSRLTLTSRGLFETVTFSFLSEEKARWFGWKETEVSMRVDNPISVELSIMRPSALPNLIDAAIRNDHRGYAETALFEVGPSFAPDLPSAQTMVTTGLRAGKTGARHWSAPQRSVDVYDVKADVMAILQTHGLGDLNYQIEATAPAYYHPGRCATLMQGKKVLAYFGEIHPALHQKFDTKLPLVGFEVFIDQLPLPKMKKGQLSLSCYQSVTRDFAFVIDREKSVDALVKSIQKVDKTLISRVDVFDVYQGDKIEADQKSVALEVRLDPQAGTLTDEQIQELTQKIIAQAEKATGAHLRQ